MKEITNVENRGETKTLLHINKLFIKGLKIAVETGAVSITILQRKLDVGYKDAGEILDWMTEQGYVKEEPDSYLKTTLMSEEDFEELRKQTGYSFKTKREKQRTIDEALYKACLRLAIKKNCVHEKMLKDSFAIGSVRAKAVIDKMQDDGNLGGFDGLSRKILITKEKFREIYGEEL